MTLIEKIAKIKSQLGANPTKLAKSLDQPTGMEAGIKHPSNEGYLIVRDDSVVEIGSGPGAVLLLDGAQGLGHLRAAGLAIEAQHLHFHTPAGGLYFGYQRFNPQWFTRPEDPVSWAFNAPLVPDNLAALTALFSIPFVTGAPNAALGQGVVFLGNYIRPQPLFGPNEQFLILGKNIANLTRRLTAVF